MQFAVIETGGKQYIVKPGDELKIELVYKADGSEYAAGEAIVFDRVLMVDDGENTTVGSPYIASASVQATVTGEGRAKKIRISKYKPKVRYRLVKGHRQHFSSVKIDSIN